MSTGGYNVIKVEQLRVELQKTAVISKEYACHLVLMALASYEEGFKDGILFIKEKEDLDKRLARKRKELDEIR